MKILMVTALMLGFCVNFTGAQTARDIERVYGQPLTVYSVSEHIWMTPEYAADGSVCFIRLYPKRINGNTNYVCHSCGLYLNELTSVLNKLVPPDTRGLQNESFGQTATGGPAAWTTYGYENVTFTFVSPFGPLPYDPSRKEEFVFTVDYPGPPEKPKSRLPTADDFTVSATDQIVSISWNKRKCAIK